MKRTQHILTLATVDSHNLITCRYLWRSSDLLNHVKDPFISKNPMCLYLCLYVIVHSWDLLQNFRILTFLDFMFKFKCMHWLFPSGHLRSTSIPKPPAILQREQGADLWGAICQRHPIKLWSALVGLAMQGRNTLSPYVFESQLSE